MSRYLEHLATRQREVGQTPPTPKGPTPARIESWRQWNVTRRQRANALARARDRDLALRMAAFLADLSPQARDGVLAIDEMRDRFPGHNRANIGAALRAAGWVSVQRTSTFTACGKRWVWVRAEGPLGPRW